MFAKRHHLLEAGSSDQETWVIFDNTAMGHATANAIWLEDAVSSHPMLASTRPA
jgi:uncharacterized protein YecE (DUF72 family)